VEENDVDGRKEGRKEGWMDGWKDGWMEGRKEERKVLYHTTVVKQMWRKMT
jgi:hypothetical protein